MKMMKILFAGLALTMAAPAFAGDLTIDLSGVRTAKGDLFVSLQTRDQFLKNAGSYGTIIREPVAGDHRLVIKDVAPGDYSISVWHDIDGDGNFSMAANGMPADGWSMVGAEKLRAEPTWDQSKITIPASGTAIKLVMIYPAK